MTTRGTIQGHGRSHPPAAIPRKRGRPGLRAWLRAWQSVMQDPDREVPEPALPPEGVPIPPSLGVCCPECGHSLTGLREWFCAGCGQRFSLPRAYTLTMMKQPEFLLRYRYSPVEIRLTLWAMLLFACGGALTLLIEVTPPVRLGLIVSGFFGVILVPNMILIRWAVGFSWPRLFFWLALLFFLGVLVFIGVPWSQ